MAKRKANGQDHTAFSRRWVLERKLSKYKRLDDDGIAEVLKSVRKANGRSIDVPNRELKDAINEVVSLTDWWRSENAKHPPHRQVDRLKKAESTLEAALATLLDCDPLTGVAATLDRLAGREPFTLDSLPQFPPAWWMFYRFAMPIVPSNDSMKEVMQACDAMRMLINTVRARRETTRGRQHQPDGYRYALIITLARTFEQFFGLPPSVTRGKPCHVFLTEVLIRCGEKIGQERLYTVWLDARRWGLASGLIERTRKTRTQPR